MILKKKKKCLHVHGTYLEPLAISSSDCCGSSVGTKLNSGLAKDDAASSGDA